MSTYSDATQQIGDQWIAALKRAEEAITAVTNGIGSAIGKIDLPDLPKLPVPDQVVQAGEAITAAMPQPTEIVEANFALAERLLEAQRDLTVRLLEAVADLRGQRQAP